VKIPFLSMLFLRKFSDKKMFSDTKIWGWGNCSLCHDATDAKNVTKNYAGKFYKIESESQSTTSLTEWDVLPY